MSEVTSFCEKAMSNLCYLPDYYFQSVPEHSFIQISSKDLKQPQLSTKTGIFKNFIDIMLHLFTDNLYMFDFLSQEHFNSAFNKNEKSNEN